MRFIKGVQILIYPTFPTFWGYVLLFSYFLGFVLLILLFGIFPTFVLLFGVFFRLFLYIYQAQNRKGCLTAPLSVTGGHILIQIGKFFGILYYWVYITNLSMIGGLLLYLL